MAVSKQSEEWFKNALERSVAAMREKKGVRDYESVDPPVFMQYVLQHFASYCLVNDETSMKVAARMIGWDAKTPDKRVGGVPRQIFHDQWNRALEFARSKIYEGTCRKYFGGIIDSRGSGTINLAVRNAMEKDADSVKFKDEDGDETVGTPLAALKSIGFTDISEDQYNDAAEFFRKNLKQYTTLRSKRAPNLTGDVLEDFTFCQIEDEDGEES